MAAGTDKATAYIDVTSRKMQNRERRILPENTHQTLTFMLYEDTGLIVGSMHEM